MFLTFFIYKISVSMSNLNEEKIVSEIEIHDLENKHRHSLNQIQLEEEEEGTLILLKDHLKYPERISSSYVVNLDVIEEVSGEDSLNFDNASINYSSTSDLKRKQLYDENTVENNVSKYALEKINFKRYFANTGGLGLMTCLILVVLVLLLFLIFLVPETLRFIFTLMIASIVLIAVIIAIYYYWEWYME